VISKQCIWNDLDVESHHDLSDGISTASARRYWRKTKRKSEYPASGPRTWTGFVVPCMTSPLQSYWFTWKLSLPVGSFFHLHVAHSPGREAARSGKWLFNIQYWLSANRTGRDNGNQLHGAESFLRSQQVLN